MAYTRTYDGKWIFTLDKQGPMLVAQITSGDTAFELMTLDTTMLQLPGMGYEPKLTQGTDGEPWIVWNAASRSAAYVWVCSQGVAAWSTYLAEEMLEN